MSEFGHNWLNAQATRKYPLDDNATGVSDDGTEFKTDIIADLHIRWPSLAGQYAFIGGVTVTENIVTVVILGADSTTATAAFTPLASVSIPQPVARYQYYNLEAIYPGTGGFIAFEDVAEACAVRFSTPAQGLLAPKIARPYAELPITEIKKYNRADHLTGIVKLLPGTDIEIVKDTIAIEGDDTEAIVIRLKSPTSDRNILSDYIGPCGVRPESGNCKRIGIETINGVQPDCDGNLTIDFRGFTVGPYESCGADNAGVTLDQLIGIGDVCVARGPERFAGTDYCDSMSSSSVSASSASSISASSSSLSSSSSSSAICTALPFTDCFNGEIHSSWQVINGTYDLVPSDMPEVDDCLPPSVCWRTSTVIAPSSSSWISSSSSSCYVDRTALQLNRAAGKNLMLWQDCGVIDTEAKIVTVRTQLTNLGSKQNAGVVLNYHLVDPFTSPRYEYFLIQINKNTNKIELLRYNGGLFITENAATPGLPFSLADWYEIKATTQYTGGGNAQINVVVTGITNPSWPQVSFTVITSQWGEPDGDFGLYTSRAVSNFDYWRVQDA